jgi:hypothetical protein
MTDVERAGGAMFQAPRLPQCIECGDQEAEIKCLGCEEPFCAYVRVCHLVVIIFFFFKITLEDSPCYQQQHRRGTRTKHKFERLMDAVMPAPAGAVMGLPSANSAAATVAAASASAAAAAAGAAEAGDEPAAPVAGKARLAFWASVPLRLTDEERSLLTVLQGMLHVSECVLEFLPRQCAPLLTRVPRRYTDNVDVSRYWGREELVATQLDLAFNTLTGLLVTHGLATHKDAALRTHAQNSALLRTILEVGRRFKVTRRRRRFCYILLLTCHGLGDEPREDALDVREDDVPVAGCHRQQHGCTHQGRPRRPDPGI